MFIDGFAFSGYKSFGNELQKVGPLSKVNVLAGQNNSGKSNTLSFLTKNYKTLVQATTKRGVTILRSDLDSHQGEIISDMRFGIGLTLGGANHKMLLDRCQVKLNQLPDNYGLNDFEFTLKLISNLFNSKFLTNDGKVAWFEYVAPIATNDFFTISARQFDSLYGEFRDRENHISHTWNTLDYANREYNSSVSYKEKLMRILNFIGPHNLAVPEMHLIPAIRQIGSAGTEYSDYSGAGIIRRLHELQNPSYNQQHLKANFRKINEFLRSITGNADAELEIPRDEQMIMVHMDNKTLPISSLGTGIHEVVILAAAATMIENQIVCIEEPELHLHPILQRKLVRYLQEKTSNQYFLTTHSAPILDTPGVQIFHVQHENGKSKINSVSTSVEKSMICADLGYRASDLVQANSVIWVEGPSDRIYLRHWIKSLAPELVEGLHYSIMFYGGRLLSHLTANDPEVEDFISLRRLNRYICILIDSDRDSSSKSVNKTKIRIQREFNEGAGFAWITKGREIENYIAPALLFDCVKVIRKDAQRLNKTGQFDHCLPYLDSKGVIKDEVDKVKVAHEVVKHAANLEILDLRKRVEEIVNFVKEANDIPNS